MTKKFEFIKKYKLVTIITVFLLFIMGFEIGSDGELFDKLPEIGISALVIAVSGILGSMFLTTVFEKIKNRFFLKNNSSDKI